jgi:hypothetical protein
MLSLLNKLIFNTTDVYHVQGLIIQLNNGLTETINEWEKQKEQLVNDNESNEGDNTTSKELTGKIECSSKTLVYFDSIHQNTILYRALLNLRKSIHRLLNYELV